MRMMEMITLEAFDRKTNSPCQYLRKFLENSLENMHTDGRV